MLIETSSFSLLSLIEFLHVPGLVSWFAGTENSYIVGKAKFDKKDTKNQAIESNEP